MSADALTLFPNFHLYVNQNILNLHIEGLKVNLTNVSEVNSFKQSVEIIYNKSKEMIDKFTFESEKEVGLKFVEKTIKQVFDNPVHFLTLWQSSQ